MKQFRFGFAITFVVLLASLSFGQEGGSNLEEEPPITVSSSSGGVGAPPVEEAPPVEVPPATVPTIREESVASSSGPSAAEVKLAKELAELQKQLENDPKVFSPTAARQRANVATKRTQRRVRSIALQFSGKQAAALRRFADMDIKKAIDLVNDLKLSVKNIKSTLGQLDTRIDDLEDTVDSHDAVINYYLKKEGKIIVDEGDGKYRVGDPEQKNGQNPLDNWPLILGGIVIVACIAGAIYYFFFHKRGP
jgi:hypothetical protein